MSFNKNMFLATSSDLKKSMMLYFNVISPPISALLKWLYLHVKNVCYAN